RHAVSRHAAVTDQTRAEALDVDITEPGLGCLIAYALGHGRGIALLAIEDAQIDAALRLRPFPPNVAVRPLVVLAVCSIEQPHIGECGERSIRNVHRRRGSA